MFGFHWVSIDSDSDIDTGRVKNFLVGHSIKLKA